MSATYSLELEFESITFRISQRVLRTKQIETFPEDNIDENWGNKKLSLCGGTAQESGFSSKIDKNMYKNFDTLKHFTN